MLVSGFSCFVRVVSSDYGKPTLFWSFREVFGDWRKRWFAISERGHFFQKKNQCLLSSVQKRKLVLLPRKLTAGTWKWWFLIGISSSRGSFSGSMWVFRGVTKSRIGFGPSRSNNSSGRRSPFRFPWDDCMLTYFFLPQVLTLHACKYTSPIDATGFGFGLFSGVNLLLNSRSQPYAWTPPPQCHVFLPRNKAWLRDY